MKYFLIAGERSGDLHASKLMAAIAQLDAAAEFVGIGGDYMSQSGMETLIHYRSMSYMGIVEVMKHLPAVLSNFKKAKSFLSAHNPDVLILIDFAAFNMKMAKYASRLGIKTVYYISPKVWAWNESRVDQIKKYVNKLLCILPFEVEYFRTRGYEARYVGSPVVERVQDYTPTQIDVTTQEKLIAFLPGSRVHEVTRSLGVIKELARLKPDWFFAVAGVRNLPEALYGDLTGSSNVQVFFDRTYDVLVTCDAAVVTSGTATLETALLNVPQIVCYRTSNFTYQVGKRLIKVPFLSLVNLIAGREVVQELVQSDYNAPRVITELKALVQEGRARQEMIQGYSEVRAILGNQSASETSAKEIVAFAQKE